MSKLEIGEQGQVIVAPEIRGTHEDPTLPLVTRLRLLAEKGDTQLLSEAADQLASNRTAAERRANTQKILQQQLSFARQEIDFLRKYMREHYEEPPEFFIPVG